MYAQSMLPIMSEVLHTTNSNMARTKKVGKCVRCKVDGVEVIQCITPKGEKFTACLDCKGKYYEQELTGTCKTCTARSDKLRYKQFKWHCPGCYEKQVELNNERQNKRMRTIEGRLDARSEQGSEESSDFDARTIASRSDCGSDSELAQSAEMLELISSLIIGGADLDAQCTALTQLNCAYPRLRGEVCSQIAADDSKLWFNLIMHLGAQLDEKLRNLEADPADDEIEEEDPHVDLEQGVDGDLEE